LPFLSAASWIRKFFFFRPEAQPDAASLISLLSLTCPIPSGGCADLDICPRSQAASIQTFHPIPEPSGGIAFGILFAALNPEAD
jgi:hypothetical protein